MVNRPNTVVPDQQAVTAQVRRGGGVEIAMRRSSAADNGSSGRLCREPHNSAFPVMTVSQAGRRRVLGHVPGVHDGESAVVRASASVYLAGAAATSV